MSLPKTCTEEEIFQIPLGDMISDISIIKLLEEATALIGKVKNICIDK